MKGEHKIKEQLTNELAKLRQRVAELEASEAERKRAEEELRATKERLQYLVSSSPAVIYTSKPSGDYGATFIGENVISQMGYEPQEFIEDPGFWADHVHPEDAPRIFDGLPRLFEHGHHTHEYRFLLKDGTYRWMRDEMKLGRDADGNPVEIIGYWIDITERKRLEDELRKHRDHLEELVEERTAELKRAKEELETEIAERVRAEESLRLLSSVAEQSSEGMAVADLEGGLLFTNDAFAAMHGYAPEELVGQHLSIFHTPEQTPSVEAANRQIQETGEFSGELWHVRRDGTVFPTLMHNSLLRDETGNLVGMIATLRDITEIKRAEDDLRRRAKELEGTNAELERFNRLAVGRELRMIELKRQVNELSGQLGKEPRYDLSLLE